MTGIDEMNKILDEIATELPEGVFDRLNGGVSLIDRTKPDESDPDGELYTLGEYHHDQMGRYITLYYGSICAVHGRENRAKLKESLRKLLCHELTHHLESLAGAHDLEIEDKIYLNDYFREKQRRRYKIVSREKAIRRRG